MKNISDEQLKAYFLGKLPGKEAETLEIECAEDAEIYERAQTVERELTDDYLRGNLSPADFLSYETNYLVTEERRKKFRVAAQLWEIVREPAPPPVSPVASKAAPVSFWQTLFGHRRGFQIAFGGVFLLLTFGAIAFYLLTLNVNKTEIAEVEEPAQSSKPENPRFENPDPQPVQNPPAAENQNPKPVSPNESVQNKEIEKAVNAAPKNLPEAKTVSSPKPLESNKLAMAMTFKLLPGSLRGEDEQSITIAPNVKNLNLLLSPAGEPNNYKIYRAVVRTAENKEIFISPNLRALSFTIPAEKMENRTYIISLEGQNPQKEFESIADYTLRVRR
jgi:hypothetical protein